VERVVGRSVRRCRDPRGPHSRRRTRRQRGGDEVRRGVTRQRGAYRYSDQVGDPQVSAHAHLARVATATAVPESGGPPDRATAALIDPRRAGSRQTGNRWAGTRAIPATRPRTTRVTGTTPLSD